MLAKLISRRQDGSGILDRGKGMFYRRSLVLILLITSVPGLITGFSIYWFAGGRIESEMVQLHKNQISRRAESLDAQFAHSELTLSHWAFDPLFDFRLLETDFYRQFSITQGITTTLMIMEGSMPLATKLELFVDGSIPVHFSPNFNLMEPAAEDWQQYRKLMDAKPNAYWALVPSSSGKPDDHPDLALVHKIPGGTTEPFGLLVARTDAAKLHELMKTLTPYEDGEAILLREDGTVLMSTTADAPSSMLDALKSEVVRKGEEASSFLWTWEKRTYSVSFGQFERIGTKWTYVSLAPVNAITGPVIYLSKLVFLASGAALLLAAVLAWIASRRIYSPLRRLLELFSGGKGAAAGPVGDEFQMIEDEWRHLTRQSMALQSKLESQLPQVKQGFLHQLMQGYLSSYTEEDLQERMRQYGWNVDDCLYQVLFIRLTGMSHPRMKGRFSLGDEGLISFAAANIVREMAGDRFEQCEVINFHDLTVGVLLGFHSRKQADRPRLYELAEALSRALNQILKLHVTISIGCAGTKVKQIPALLEEAKLALNYRKWDEDNQILDVEMLPAREKSQGFRYPFAAEREIIQAMRTGKLDEAERQLQAFLEELMRQGVTDLDVQQGVMNLLGSLEHEIMQSGLNPNQLLAPVNRYEQLSALQEPEQIRQWFAGQVIAPFLAEMESRSDHKIKKIVEAAIQFIQKHYMKDISLDDCAEYCGTSTFLLSRSFKQVCGKNFIDYLTDLRMEKAKALLRDSERKIFDIAEQVGYQHSYFNRLFKKFEGVTPTQYRERARTAQADQASLLGADMRCE